MRAEFVKRTTRLYETYCRLWSYTWTKAAAVLVFAVTWQVSDEGWMYDKFFRIRSNRWRYADLTDNMTGFFSHKENIYTSIIRTEQSRNIKISIEAVSISGGGRNQLYVDRRACPRSSAVEWERCILQKTQPATDRISEQMLLGCSRLGKKTYRDLWSSRSKGLMRDINPKGLYRRAKVSLAIRSENIEWHRYNTEDTKIYFKDLHLTFTYCYKYRYMHATASHMHCVNAWAMIVHGVSQ